MDPDLQILPAAANQSAELTTIALAAKRHWGYPETWIERWREALTLAPAYLTETATFVAAVGKVAIGFASVRFDGSDAWLDHLWVLPAHMHRGCGRRLFVHAEAYGRSTGAARLCLEADPHAEGFYLRMGMETSTRIPATMDGHERFLAKMEKRLR